MRYLRLSKPVVVDSNQFYSFLVNLDKFKSFLRRLDSAFKIITLIYIDPFIFKFT